MVEIVTPNLPVYRDRRLSDFAAPGQEVLGALGGEALHDNPTAQTARAIDLDEAEQGRRISRWGGRYEPDSPLLDQNTAKTRLKDSGLDGQLDIPETGIRQRSLDLLIENRKEVNRRNAIISRSPGGVGLGAAGIATQLGVSLLDPVNVAMAFVPVVGEARYAKMIANAGSAFGRVGVRAGVGALEGAAGTALLQPLTMATDRAYQEEYGLNDALANIVFGGLFGAAIHNIAPAARGAVRLARGRDTTVHQAALSEALAAHLEGRTPRVSEVLRAVQKLNARQEALRGGTSLTPAARVDIPQSALTPEAQAPVLRGADPQTAVVPMTDDLGRPQIFPTKSAAEKVRKQLKKEGVNVRTDELPQGGFRLTEPAKVEVLDSFAERRAAENEIKRMPPAEREGLRVVPVDATGRRKFAIVRGLTDRQAAAAEKNPSILNEALDTRPPQAETAPEPTPNQFDQAFDDANPLETVLRQIRDDRVSLPPDEAAALTEIQTLAKGFDTGNQVEAQLAEIESFVSATEELISLEREAGRITPEMDSALKDAAQAVSDAEKRGAGLRQAAFCIGRAI